MPRPVYLTVYNSPLVPAHWALWVPRASPSNVRKRIHATGDARNGFTVAFERNYDIDATSRTYQLLALVQVLNHYAVDVTGDGSCTPDQTAHDYLEQVAFRIPAPGAKLVSATSSVCFLASLLPSPSKYINFHDFRDQGKE